MVKAIKFYATWCGPCRAYTKTWDKVTEELSNEAEFIEVDIDKDTEGLAAKYRIRSVPTTIFVNEKDTVKKVGILSESEIKELIK